MNLNIFNKIIILVLTFNISNTYSIALEQVWKSNNFGNYLLFQNPSNNNLLFDSNGKLIELNYKDGKFVREFEFYNLEIEISPNTVYISNNETRNNINTTNIYNFNTLELFHTIENANLCKFIDDENIIYKMDNENLDSTNFVIYNLITKEKKVLRTFFDITAIAVSKYSNKIILAHKDRIGKIKVAVSMWDLNTMTEIAILDIWENNYIASSYIGKIEFSNDGNYFVINGKIVLGNVWYFDGIIYDVTTLKQHKQFNYTNNAISQNFGGFLTDSLIYVVVYDNTNDKYITNFINLKDNKTIYSFDKGLFNCIYNENEKKIYAKVVESSFELDGTYTACYQLPFLLSINNWNEIEIVTYSNNKIFIKNVAFKEKKMFISSIDGKVIFSQIILNKESNIQIPIDLPNGLFLIFLTDDKEHTKVYKILVNE